MAAAVTILIPLTRDAAGRLLDRYVYRTHANYQRTIREASRVLTRVLHLDKLLAFITTTVLRSTGAEGVAIYLREGKLFQCATSQLNEAAGHFAAPVVASVAIARALEDTQQPILTHELIRESHHGAAKMYSDLALNGWSLLLPVTSEDTLIAIIAVGPKLSGDAFYQEDLDLLMTLANQAAIAVKNAQLYASMVVSNEYLENIVSTIETGVIAIDSGGQISKFNRAAEQLTGLSASMTLNRDVKSVPDCLAAPLLATVRDGAQRLQPEVELPTISDAGLCTRPVICTTSPVRDPTDKVLGAVAVFSDLAPLKELEAKRRSAERLLYFQTLAAGIAHEIKNPLVAIKTFTQLLPRRRQDPRFLDEFGRISLREIDRMQRIVDRLSALSRPTERPSEAVDVRDPLRDALEFIQPTVEEKKIFLSASMTTESCLVVGDPGELEQLFLNLILNAYDATPSGGAVFVEAVRIEREVIVRVSDSGHGIAPDVIDKIFEPFTTTRARGSGLGLAISSGIAQAHGGRLTAHNNPNGGAIFTVQLPIAIAMSGPNT